MSTWEKLHTDASGVPGPAPGGRPWLNTVEVVDGILRAFMADVLRKTGTEGGFNWTMERANQLNAMFLGNGYADDTIYGTGPWNTPEFIGHNCIKALRISGEDRKGPGIAILAMAADILDVVSAHEGEEPEAYGHEMDRIMERTRNALLGLPVVLP
jgi:hypothetical protein